MTDEHADQHAGPTALQVVLELSMTAGGAHVGYHSVHARVLERWVRTKPKGTDYPL